MVKEMTVKNLLSPLTPSGIKKKFKGLFYFVFEFRRVVNLSRWDFLKIVIDKKMVDIYAIECFDNMY